MPTRWLAYQAKQPTRRLANILYRIGEILQGEEDGIFGDIEKGFDTGRGDKAETVSMHRREANNWGRSQPIRCGNKRKRSS